MEPDYSDSEISTKSNRNMCNIYNVSHIKELGDKAIENINKIRSNVYEFVKKCEKENQHQNFNFNEAFTRSFYHFSENENKFKTLKNALVNAENKNVEMNIEEYDILFYCASINEVNILDHSTILQNHIQRKYLFYIKDLEDRNQDLIFKNNMGNFLSLLMAVIAISCISCGFYRKEPDMIFQTIGIVLTSGVVILITKSIL